MNTLFNLRKTALGALCVVTLAPAILFAGNTSKLSEERGTIKAVDSKTHQLVVTADQKHKTAAAYLWNEQTKFTEHNKPVDAGALKAGRSVQLTFTPGGATPTLTHVNLTAPPEPRHSAAAGSAAKPKS